jgi:Tol biopolymer transport system component
MNRKTLILLFSLLFVSMLIADVRGQKENKPVSSETPLLFGEGVISTPDNEGNLSLAPDGKTLYFTKFAPFDTSFVAIVVSRLRGNNWSKPEIADFSSPGNDGDPFVAPDGSKIFYVSFRSADGKRKADTDIWMVEKLGDKWSAGKNLGATVNTDGFELSPNVTKDGTLYFWSIRKDGKGGGDIYRSRLTNGEYAAPENLGEIINSPGNETDLFVAPDESYLIFTSDRPGGEGGGDLYISYRDGSSWTTPKNLGKTVNTKATETAPYVTPDGKQLLFVSTRGAGDNTPSKSLTYDELNRALKGANNGRRNIYAVTFALVNGR